MDLHLFVSSAADFVTTLWHNALNDYAGAPTGNVDFPTKGARTIERKQKWNRNETERKQKGNRNSPETVLKQIWNRSETDLKQTWKKHADSLAWVFPHRKSQR